MNGTAKYGEINFRSACQGGGSCVEVGTLKLVAVRDSKNPDGPVLLFSLAEWAEFLQAANAGEFDME
jgi:Domain of unknown function (DUF397)